jgi:hypothetical protein
MGVVIIPMLRNLNRSWQLAFDGLLEEVMSIFDAYAVAVLHPYFDSETFSCRLF